MREATAWARLGDSLDDPALPKRRALFASLAALLGGGGGWQTKPALAAAALPVRPFPNGVSLLVPGPPGGVSEQWGLRLASVLPPTLPAQPLLTARWLGGPDGVSAANQFEVRAAADGATLLMVAAPAALAALVGDPRAHYQPSQWLAVMALHAPAVMIGRVPQDALRRGAHFTVAAGAPVGLDLPGLIALDLLGIAATPIFGFRSPTAKRQALASGGAELALLTGADVPAEIGRLGEIGARPLFSFGLIDATGRWIRDPLVAKVPQFGELAQALGVPPPAGALAQSFCALAAASGLGFGLALPFLTPSAMVALWRCAAWAAVHQSGLMRAATGSGELLLAGALALANMAALTPSTSALLALRSWLAERLGWRPS